MIRPLEPDARPVSIKSRVRVLPVPEDFVQQAVDCLDELPAAAQLTVEACASARSNCSINRLFRSGQGDTAGADAAHDHHHAEEEQGQQGVEERLLRDLTILKWKGTTVQDELHTNTISLYKVKCRLASSDACLMLYVKEVSRESGFLQSYKNDSFVSVLGGPHPGRFRVEYCQELIEYADTGNELENTFELVEWDGQMLLRSQLEGHSWGSEENLQGFICWLESVFGPYATHSPPDAASQPRDRLRFMLHIFRALAAVSLTMCQHRPSTQGLRWPESVLRGVLTPGATRKGSLHVVYHHRKKGATRRGATPSSSKGEEVRKKRCTLL